MCVFRESEISLDLDYTKATKRVVLFFFLAGGGGGREKAGDSVFIDSHRNSKTVDWFIEKSMQ